MKDLNRKESIFMPENQLSLKEAHKKKAAPLNFSLFSGNILFQLLLL